MSRHSLKRTRSGLLNHLEVGVRAHQAQNYDHAAECYAYVLANEPNNVDALHLLGLVERERHNADAALKNLQRVVELSPTLVEAQVNLGLIKQERGDVAGAIASYRRASELNPQLVEPWFNLGNLYRDQGDSTQALQYYETALAQESRLDVWRNYAALLIESEQVLAAIAAYREAVKLAPHDPELLNSLGAILQTNREFAEAITCYYRATQIKPDCAEAHNNLGNALKDYHRPAEAVVCYRRALDLKPEFVPAWNNLGSACLDLGRMIDATAAFRRALEIAPEFAEAHLNLGNVLKVSGHLSEASYCYLQALKAKPDLVQAHNNLGVIATEQGDYAGALVHLERALVLDPTFAEAHNNLGNVYKNQALLNDALRHFARAVELRPDYSGAHSNLLFTLNFVDGVEPADIFELHRDFNARHAAHLANSNPLYENLPDATRRLKIGYVSPDFRAHACAFFVEPIFKHHDRNAVELYAYAEVAQPDAVTRRLQQQVDVWRSTVGLNDEQVAALIRADGVDIVIDLAGHTANGRLLALARKPAPIQMTYLGYPATTGLDVMDYRLTDAVTEPLGMTDAYYSETLLRMPHSLWCYQPFSDMPEVNPLPALRNSHITFASLNNYAKIGPRVIELWAQVLNAIPDARLVMITVPSGNAQRELIAQFEALGVNASRLSLHDRLARQPYLELFGQIDIALDPFPCNGGTTTCDALWMGIPVVTLIGNTFLSRASYSLLAATGLAEYAAADHTHFIEICVNAVRDISTLATRRATMRSQVAQSPLLDAIGFARDLEGVYRDVWGSWCSLRQNNSS